MNLVSRMISPACFAVACGLGAAAAPAQAQWADTSFFVTSTAGKGGDLGGLAGADNQCQTLAQAAGAGRQDLARLSLDPGRDGKPAVNARTASARAMAERQGRGGRQGRRRSARRSNNLTKQTALSEKGEVINGRGDTPNRHDMLTGSQADGTAFAAGEDRTCKNWTSSTQGAAMVGHPDRRACRRRADEVVEFVASLARAGRRLLPGRPEEHRRRRPAVLLRGEYEVIRIGIHCMKIIDAQVHIWSQTVTPTSACIARSRSSRPRKSCGRWTRPGGCRIDPPAARLGSRFQCAGDRGGPEISRPLRHHGQFRAGRP